MKQTLCYAVAVVALAFSSPAPAAQEERSRPAGERRIADDWSDWRARWEERGLRFSAQWTTEGWGNVRGGDRRGGVHNGLLEGELELDLEKHAGWNGATFFNRWYLPYGRDLSSDYVGNLFTVSHAAADRSFFLYELWLEQTWGGEALSVRLGQLAADAEFAVTEHGSLFLNATFGWPPFLSENLPGGGPAFPRGTPGARVAVQVSKRLKLQTAIYQGDPLDDASNRHGMKWRPGGKTGYLVMNEAQFHWNGESATALTGEVKGGFWVHTGEVDGADENSARRRKGNFGVYGVVDQMLYRPGDVSLPVESGLGWFARVALQPQERNTIGFYLDTGLAARGLFPSRRDDAFGIGFALGKMTAGARRAIEEEGSHGVRPEMLVELTYCCQLSPSLTVQPDLQWIIHPGGRGDHGNALVVGLRSTWSF